MKYICLIYSDESQWPKLPQNAMEQMMSEYREFTNSIKASGHYVTGDRLQPSTAATTVRVRDGRLSSTDGPFAETKEQLGGYYIVEAKNADEAVAIAGRIPSVRVGGSVEVRPIMEMGPPPR